ncbi:MAG: serine protease [Planctomycetes bacterium]|nr:serine protease [Planctomycetota bacterium]MBL7037605.1 serine protease [Pirellulaceae bacterium]
MKHEGNGNDHHSASIILPTRGKDKHHSVLVQGPNLIRLIVGIVGISSCSLAHAAESVLPPAQLYEQAKRASAEILIDGRHGGSGCFVSEEGLVITAAHIPGRPGRNIEVLTSDGGRLKATVVAVDLGHDLILLRVAPREGGYPVLKLGAEVPPPGAGVFLYSASAFRHGLLQTGTVARDGLTFEQQGHFIEVTQIAAVVQEGTSGGPWINREGGLIGVQSGSITNKSVPGGIANVSPVHAVRVLLETKRNASTPVIGVFVDELWVLPPDQQRRFPPAQEGMVVQSLQPDGPAARAGINKGEVLVAVDGQKVRLRDDYVRLVRAKKPGQSVELTLIGADGTGTRKVTVPIGKLEVGWPEENAAGGESP